MGAIHIFALKKKPLSIPYIKVPLNVCTPAKVLSTFAGYKFISYLILYYAIIQSAF